MGKTPRMYCFAPLKAGSSRSRGIKASMPDPLIQAKPSTLFFERAPSSRASSGAVRADTRLNAMISPALSRSSRRMPISVYASAARSLVPKSTRETLTAAERYTYAILNSRYPGKPSGVAAMVCSVCSSLWSSSVKVAIAPAMMPPNDATIMIISNVTACAASASMGGSVRSTRGSA
ncbi:hypothetical protein SDC9_182696 [bioreactor metagenome]|uniref:Uncharacterized protein n=1 Tax=bioreactor metagenome TaxID=1076179 RepID=A0A645HAQ1_9ZZZZ